MGFELVKAGINVPVHVDRLVISAIVLDMSTSMQKFGDAPPKAVEECISRLREDHNAFYVVCVVGFSDDAHVLVYPTEVNLIGSIRDQYRPNGNTLLYKTVDDVLLNLKKIWEKLAKEHKRHTRVTVGVFSDGEDNQSNDNFFPRKVQETSGWARQEGWELSAFGIGIESVELALLLGFDKKLAVTVPASRAGIRHASHMFSSRTIIPSQK